MLISSVFNRKPTPVVSFLVRKMNNFENVRLERWWTASTKCLFFCVGWFSWTATWHQHREYTVLPLCPRPLDYGWPAVTSHCSKLSIIMFIVASSATGWRGQVAAEETHPSALHPSFRLILSSGRCDTCQRAEHRELLQISPERGQWAGLGL